MEQHCEPWLCAAVAIQQVQPIVPDSNLHHHHHHHHQQQQQQSFSELLSQLQPQSGNGPCTAVWTAGAIAYRCKTCAETSSSAVCVACFKAGGHEQHDYIMYRRWGDRHGAMVTVMQQL
jgi:G3E family GTPase